MLKAVSSLAALVMAVSARKLSAEKALDMMQRGVRMPPAADNSTYGNTEQIHTQHLKLDLQVDFDTRQLVGSATH